jgi:hypothetical protein
MGGFVNGRCYSDRDLRRLFHAITRGIARQRHVPELADELEGDNRAMPPGRCRDLGLPAGATYAKASRHVRRLVTRNSKPPSKGRAGVPRLIHSRANLTLNRKSN